MAARLKRCRSRSRHARRQNCPPADGQERGECAFRTGCPASADRRLAGFAARFLARLRRRRARCPRVVDGTDAPSANSIEIAWPETSRAAAAETGGPVSSRTSGIAALQHVLVGQRLQDAVLRRHSRCALAPADGGSPYRRRPERLPSRSASGESGLRSQPRAACEDGIGAADTPRVRAVDHPLDDALGAGHPLAELLPPLGDPVRQHVGPQMRGDALEGAALVERVQSPARGRGRRRPRRNGGAAGPAAGRARAARAVSARTACRR